MRTQEDRITLTSPEIAYRNMIWWICGFTVASSLVLFTVVLAIQYTNKGSAAWDFQGAAGAATVIPSFAGVVLAGWAIYFQIKTNTPTYKNAEATLVGLQDLGLRLQRLRALRGCIEDADAANEYQMQTEIESHLEELLEEGREDSDTPNPRGWRKMHGHMSLKRFFSEFEQRGPDEESHASNFADLVCKYAQIIDRLKQRMKSCDSFDLTALEVKIMKVAIVSGDAKEDDFAYMVAVKIADEVIESFGMLLQSLQHEKLLTIDSIKEVIIAPPGYRLPSSTRHHKHQ